MCIFFYLTIEYNLKLLIRPYLFITIVNIMFCDNITWKSKMTEKQNITRLVNRLC